MEKMAEMIKENGLVYHLGKDGLYYPNLEIPKGTTYPIGKYGRMRAEYLKEKRHLDYMRMYNSGELKAYLHEFEEECYEMLDKVMKQMKEKQGVTEKLKAENQMLWVGKMNNIKACAEEIVVKEMVYA